MNLRRRTIQEWKQSSLVQVVIASLYNYSQYIPGGSREYEGDYLLISCFHGDTVIETVDGPMKIKDIVEDTHVYTMDHNGNISIRPASASRITKVNTEIIGVVLNTGKVLKVTPDHKILKLGGGKGKDKGKHEWVEAKDLKPDDKLNGLYRVRRGVKYSGIKLASGSDYIMEHRAGVRVVDIIRINGKHDVYDITVEDTHNVIADGVIAHNCGEAIIF